MGKIKLILDAISTDGNLEKIINGAVQAVNNNENIILYVVGPSIEINQILIKNAFNSENLIIVDAQDKITNEDNPLQAIRQKKESSLYKSFELLKNNNDINGLVSAGATGAILCGSILNLKALSNIHPSLCTLLPNENGELFCLIDCGANVDCTSKQLFEYAKISLCYMECMYPNREIKVGLLSNGSEDNKGNTLTKQVFNLLKESDLNFIGNVEGNQILSGKCDIVICDGFIGNVVLKNIEGTAKMMIKELVKMMNESVDVVEKNILQKTINELISKYDLNSLSGATLLGVDKVIMKGHGSANSNTIFNIINQVYDLLKNDFITKLEKQLNEKK